MSHKVGTYCLGLACRAGPRLPKNGPPPRSSCALPPIRFRRLYSIHPEVSLLAASSSESRFRAMEMGNVLGFPTPSNQASVQNMDSPTDPLSNDNTDRNLTPSQEETLYTSGFIPPPANDESPDPDQSDKPVLSATGQQESYKPDEAMGGSDNAANQSKRSKYPLPTMPLPAGSHLKHRYHPVVHQLTNLLMRDGKLSVAQRNMNLVLHFLRTSPAPRYSPKFPLLPNAPPPKFLPLNPVLYLTLAVDSVAPLTRISRLKEIIGGGIALEVPRALDVRARRRTAWKWLLDAVAKKPSSGSGKSRLPHAIASEVIAVVEGRSSLWARREAVHKQAMVTRANIAMANRRSGRRKGARR